jgi:hypothetical protein
MKHFLTLVLGLTAIVVQAQEFASIGTRWNYTSDVYGPINIEQYEYTSVKDSVILGKSVRKIEILHYRKMHDYSNDYKVTEEVRNLKPHFIHQNADSVYLFDPFNEDFAKIYVFNVKKGDTITLDTPFGEELNNDDKTFRIKIDSVAVEEYGGVQLKKYRTKALDEIGHGFAGVWYMDRVGSLDWFLPRPLFGIPERPGPLLCYSDSEVNYPSGTTCETITSTIESQLELASVYPNPTKDLISVNASQNIEKIEVLSVRGDLLATFHTNQANLSAMKLGVYFLKIYSNGDFAIKKIIKE